MSSDPDQASAALPRPPAPQALPSAWTERLLAWCDTGSGSHDPAGLTRMAGLLSAAFSELGSEPERLEIGAAGPALRLRRRTEAPVRIFLNGHYDTVFGPEHPFQRARLDGERLRGPGAADMKAGLLVLLEALRRFEASPGAAALGWEVLLTPDEEIGSPHSAALLREAASRHQLALVFESSPPDGLIARARPATGTFRATLRGRSAHAGRDPAAGRNALLRLARVLLAAEDWNSRLPGVRCNVASFSAASPANVVPDLARAELGLRAADAAALASAEDALGRLTAEVSQEDGYSLEWSGGFNRPPKGVGPGDEALFARLRRVGAGLGLDLAWADTAGASDGNILQAAGLPVLDNLGVRGGGLHGADEFALLDSLPERVALTAALLEDLAADAARERPVP